MLDYNFDSTQEDGPLSSSDFILFSFLSFIFFNLEVDHKEIVINFTLMFKIFTEKLW